MPPIGYVVLQIIFPSVSMKRYIPPAAHDKNLSLYIDFDLNFQHHIKNTVKLWNYFILNIRLDASTALANALVSSRLDYCDSTTFYSKSVSG